MGVTKKLASLVVETCVEDIPKESVEFAKQLNLDCLGVTLAGSVDLAITPVTNLVRDLGGVSEAGVVSSGFRTTSTEAAFVNGTMAHVLDYDDYGFPVAHNPGHPTATMLPVLLALGEKLRLPGRSLINAYLLGLEVWARVASACAPGHIRGWHPTAIFGHLAAVSVAARLLRLSVDETRAAFGIVASLTGGLMKNFGTNTKAMHAGCAARNGIIAARFAKEGFTSNLDILDDEAGFFLAFFGENGCRKEEITRDIGRVFHFTMAAINIKKYPACGAAECPVDALLTLMREYKIEYEQIRRIELDCSPFMTKVMMYTEPKTGSEAKFSLQYVLGAAALDNKLALSHFASSKVNDPKIREAMSKVMVNTIPYWPEHLPNAASVTIVLKSDKSFKLRVDQPRGSRDIPLNMDELLAKYRDCAKLVLSPGETERTIDLMLNLEKLDNIIELAGIITG
jgi:2-methylcitrate dehydratase PrpD